MTVIHNLIRTLKFILVIAVGIGSVLSMPVMALDAQYGQLGQYHTSQVDDVGFAARAPPLAAANLAVTGGVTVMRGGAYALHGQETVAALFGFERSTIATNNAADDVFEAGANITPNSTLERYSHIGADGTFVTEVSSIENVIGQIPSNATEIRITRQQAAQLETDLGLNPGSLEANNTLSLVDDIAGRCPRCPIGGNDQFLGGGQGLPGGGSELVIDSIPSSGGNGVRQIMVIVE